MRGLALAAALIVAACGHAQPRARPIGSTATAAAPPAPEREALMLGGDPHPYLRELATSFQRYIEYPDVDATGELIGCFRVAASGEVREVTVKESSGSAELDHAVQRALGQMAVRRHRDPRPVPPELVETVTGRWLCVRMRFGGALD